jgi:hypothetical protein
VTYKTGFGLNDWINCILYIHTFPDYKQYSAITILHTFKFTVTHTLGFSVFTSRILATDFSQPHYHFKSHRKSSLHSLIHLLPFLQLPILKTRLNSIPLLSSSYPGRLASRNPTLLSRLLARSCLLCLFITPRHEPHRKDTLCC